MFLLIASVATVLCVSALCSLSEAALYSVRMPFIRKLQDEGSRAGHILANLKQNMERPITAILIVNTIANTAGSFIAGKQAGELFGGSEIFGFETLTVFMIALTLGVLLFSEILPKVAGVAYGRMVSAAIALPLAATIWALTPIVWLSQKAAALLQQKTPSPMAPEEEVHQFAALSAEEGSILPEEAALVQNVLRLNETTASDIMTPRTVVFKRPAALSVGALRDEIESIPHTRIPIHGEDPEDWLGVVRKDHILACLARDEFDVTLLSLRKPIVFVPATAPGHILLKDFLQRREHLLGIVDEYGGILGLVTLEDVVESLLGEEIVDETDLVEDLQVMARRRGRQRLAKILESESA